MVLVGPMGMRTCPTSMSFDVTFWDRWCGKTSAVRKVSGDAQPGEDFAACRRRVRVAGWAGWERLGARTPLIPWFLGLPLGNPRLANGMSRTGS
jgi:hypothetical protein